MKYLHLLFSILFISFTSCNNSVDTQTLRSGVINAKADTYKFDIKSTRLKAKEAFNFCKSKSMNDEYCILIDMKIHSGRKRFFVWDFKKDTIIHSFLVGHGCCDSEWGRDYTKDQPSFSNIEDSHCSSLGKYKIGERGYSSWGVNVKYLLHGLEASNNKALKRIIVLHSWDVVSDDEVYPNGTPEGWGCPTLSNNSFRVLDKKLKASQLPVLMWIYNN